MSTTILAGSTFEFSVDDGTTWTELLGLPEIPEFKTETGERETTTVRDTVRQYEPEMDSPTEVTLTCNYIKTDADQLAFRTLARNSSSCLVRATYSDGETAEAAVALKNYGINSGDAPSTKQFSCIMRRTGDVTFTEATS